MDIFFMILFNLFTGSIIYLVLSLKIERTSSTYQEKRLKREMNEVMTEFNAAAERNISILENRIAVIKNMAGEKGILKKLDYTVSDDIHKNESSSGVKSSLVNEDNIEVKKKSDITAEKEIDPVPAAGDGGFLLNLIDKIPFIKKGVEIAGGEIYSNKPQVETAESFSIEKELSRGGVLDLKIDEEIMPELTAEEAEDIEELFLNSDDKYSLINNLHVKGYSIEELSRYSGIPAGEVKLIISLNS